MPTHLPKRLCFFVVLFVPISPALGQEQFTFTDDFNPMSLEDYILVDPIGVLTGVPQTDFTLTDGAMRVNTTVTPNIMLGPSRGGFEFVGQPTPFTDFEISVDVLDWDDTLTSAFGPTARTRELGPGMLDGYFFTILTNTTAPGETEISDFLAMGRIDDEVTETLDATPISLDPARQYRMNFTGVGPEFSGSLFDIDDLSTAIATVAMTDATYSIGGSGIAVASAGTDPAGWVVPTARGDTTFDNYSLTATIPEPTAVVLLLFGVVGIAGHHRRRK